MIAETSASSYHDIAGFESEVAQKLDASHSRCATKDNKSGGDPAAAVVELKCQ